MIGRLARWRDRDVGVGGRNSGKRSWGKDGNVVPGEGKGKKQGGEEKKSGLGRVGGIGEQKNG